MPRVSKYPGKAHNTPIGFSAPLVGGRSGRFSVVRLQPPESGAQLPYVAAITPLRCDKPVVNLSNS
jgi:hypothetical protein